MEGLIFLFMSAGMLHFLFLIYMDKYKRSLDLKLNEYPDI